MTDITTVPLGRWHVHFDGRPEVVGHICDLHRAIGRSIGCLEQHSDGDCDHVQTDLCVCERYLPCDACAEDWEPE